MKKEKLQTKKRKFEPFYLDADAIVGLIGLLCFAIISSIIAYNVMLAEHKEQKQRVNYYNNGICLNCEGNYKIDYIKKDRIIFICDECGQRIEMKTEDFKEG